MNVDFILLTDFQSVVANPYGKIAYAVVILFLLIAAGWLLYAYLHILKQKQLLQHCEKLRSNYFTKITHELRSPLTIVLGLSKQLREHKALANQNATSYLAAIERQSRQMSSLVNQLLDITRLNTAYKTIEWATGNIVSFVEMISETYNLYARQKEVELIFFCNETDIETDFVPNFLNKILQNLLSNAVKHSPPGSKIFLILEKDRKSSRKILIRVVDHGYGIKKEVLPHIFELFYQGPSEKDQSGSGIGLALTRQLVELLGGKISVDSKEGKGAAFTVELPLQRTEKSLYPLWMGDKTGHPARIKQQPLMKADEIMGDKPIEHDPRTTILIVEDNRDVALFIRSIFSEEKYQVIHTNSGNKALEIANAYLPDIVITDVIMQDKDGIEVCKEIKRSPLLNHIPVIIVTAKNEKSDLIEGLKSGADAYIQKPFHAEELLVRVEKLLESRHLLKEKYRRTMLKDEKTDLNEQVNLDFLRHVTDIIYREMKNPEFSPKKLADELAISLSQLNKKLNATTGFPSSTYILQVKLAHAKKILSFQNKTIGEVATECGIYDVNYFSRIFKKQTGITPSQYKRLPVSN